MNKRDRKRLEKRKKFLISELEIRQTCLALTNGLADEEFSANMKAELEELNSILFALGNAPLKIGMSHKIHKMEI